MKRVKPYIKNSSAFGNALNRVIIGSLLILFSPTVVMGQESVSAYMNIEQYKTKMHYTKTGNHTDKTIVLVHGLGSYSKAFNKNIEALSQQATVYAIDLPGFGKTELGTCIPGMKNYANLITAFVTENKLKEVTLVGHSMGGQIVMALAQMQDFDWLAGLVLISPAGIELFSEDDKQWFANVVTETLYLNLTDEQIKQNFNINFYGANLPEDATFMYEDRLQIKENPQRYKQYCALVKKCIEAMLNEPVRDKIPQIKKPIKMVFGKDDLLIPNRILHPELNLLSLTESFKQEHPKISVELINNAGHFVQWDQDKEVNSMVLEFLKQTDKQQ